MDSSEVPLKTILLTPLLNPITQADNLYDKAHIRTSNCVECSCGVWKRRFPVLADGIRLNTQIIQSILVATTVLHNVACDEGEEAFAVDGEH